MTMTMTMTTMMTIDAYWCQLMKIDDDDDDDDDDDEPPGRTTTKICGIDNT